MALTAEELTELRQDTGGVTNENDKDHLTDAQLQAIYTNRSGEVWDVAIVRTLRRRVSMASPYVDKNLNLNSESMSQYVEHLKDLLKDAEKVAGMVPSVGTLTTGRMRLGLDAREDEV